MREQSPEQQCLARQLRFLRTCSHTQPGAAHDGGGRRRSSASGGVAGHERAAGRRAHRRGPRSTGAHISTDGGLIVVCVRVWACAGSGRVEHSPARKPEDTERQLVHSSHGHVTATRRKQRWRTLERGLGVLLLLVLM
jgi:hypothetical protein